MASTDPVVLNLPVTEAEVYAAIADVLDPELDEPLVKLGFIDRVQVEGADVTITFRLPTYWCAPNFAYLMASDLHASVSRLPGVGAVRVALVDHFTEDEVTSGVNNCQSFMEAFPGEADGNLDELRLTFLRKGFLMRQEVLVRRMMKAGLDEAALIALCVADLGIDEAADVALVAHPGGTLRLEKLGQKARAYLRRGVELGLLQAPDDPLIVDTDGRPIPAGGLTEFLRRSRSIRFNIAFNTNICTGLYRARYGGSAPVVVEEGASE